MVGFGLAAMEFGSRLGFDFINCYRSVFFFYYNNYFNYYPLYLYSSVLHVYFTSPFSPVKDEVTVEHVFHTVDNMSPL